MPKTAIAACLASAALTPGELLPACDSEMTAKATKIESWKPALDVEVSELRNDVFGAVMGVSALKDRLDILEKLLSRLDAAVSRQAESPQAATGPEKNQILAWVEEWFNGRVETLVEQQIASRLHEQDGTRFFRLSASRRSSDRATALASAPVILATALP